MGALMTQLGLDRDISTKRARKREFLDEMRGVVPCSRLIALIEPHYPSYAQVNELSPVFSSLGIMDRSKTSFRRQMPRRICWGFTTYFGHWRHFARKARIFCKIVEPLANGFNGNSTARADCPRTDRLSSLHLQPRVRVGTVRKLRLMAARSGQWTGPH
jgi:hypothetical protein